jgi:hypothetical protein
MPIKYLYVTAGKQVLARNKKEALYLFSLAEDKVVQWNKARRVGYATRVYRDHMCVLGYGDLYSNKPIRCDKDAAICYDLLRV